MNPSIYRNTSSNRWSCGRRAIAGTLAALTMLAAGTGCYGRFEVTRSLHHWNGHVTDNGFVNSIIMILISPIYGLTIVVDAIVVNTIDYWNGQTIHVAQTFEQPDGSTVVLAPGADDHNVVMTYYKDDTLIATRHMARDTSGTTTITDENGRVLSRVTPDGHQGFRFTDADDNPMGTLSAAQIAELRARTS